MVLTGDRGRALTADAFRHIMIDAMKEVPELKERQGLAINGVTTHGLRYTAATRLWELGCSYEMIASITGHDTIEMVRKYAENKRLASLAIDTLNAASDARKSNEVQNRSRESAKPPCGGFVTF